MKKRHNNGSPRRAYSDGFAAGLGKARAELEEQVENLKAHVARIEAENQAMREGLHIQSMKQAS